jgi:hypothetical protein
VSLRRWAQDPSPQSRFPKRNDNDYTPCFLIARSLPSRNGREVPPAGLRDGRISSGGWNIRGGACLRGLMAPPCPWPRHRHGLDGILDWSSGLIE